MSRAISAPSVQQVACKWLAILEQQLVQTLVFQHQCECEPIHLDTDHGYP
jgi:hypothetical protein